MWWMIAFSFCISVIITPIIITICKYFKFFDESDERKIHTGNIPRLGGLGIIIAFTISSLTYFIVSPANSIRHVLPLIVAGSIIFIFALADDFFNFPAKLKLIFQVIAALIVIFSGYRFKQICDLTLPLWFSYILTFFWIIGIINSYNLIDGLDGLCGGLSFLTIASLGIIFFNSARPTAAICFIMSAAIFGFLIYNKPKAKIFMGDGGSQLMGFMISALPLYYSTSNFEYNKILVMLVLVSIPMLDTISAMWRRTREHRSFMSPDARHIHHKLIVLGFSKVQTLLFLILIQVCLCLSAGLGMYLKEWKGSILLIVIFIFMIVFYSSIHFIYYAVTNHNPVDISILQNESNSKHSELNSKKNFTEKEK